MIIPTRIPETTGEQTLTHIDKFVSRGSSLFILSNHSKVPSRPMMGDSGFMADPESHHPCPGLFDQADNETFLEQCVAWLLDIPSLNFL